jgi:8-oxo-dGTP pyrophosphatase MutT (NUDIX family)
MARDPIPTWCFAVVVVRKGNSYLLVHESKHGQRWYLPAGRVEPGESFADAAYRETLEEAGVPVRLTGILRIEHTPRPDGSRLRVVFLAEPSDDTPPKTEADAESLEARWVLMSELDGLSLRGEEVRELFAYVDEGGPVYPLELLQIEGMPFKVGPGGSSGG